MAQASGGEMPPLALTAVMSSNSDSVSRRDAHAGAVEPLDRRVERRGDGIVQPVERQALGDAETQAGERRRLERRKFLAGHHGVGLGAIGDAAARSARRNRACSSAETRRRSARAAGSA